MADRFFDQSQLVFITDGYQLFVKQIVLKVDFRPCVSEQLFERLDDVSAAEPSHRKRPQCPGGASEIGGVELLDQFARDLVLVGQSDDKNHPRFGVGGDSRSGASAERLQQRFGNLVGVGVLQLKHLQPLSPTG